MRFNGLRKKSFAVALAATLAAGTVAAPASKVEAASANIPVSVMFMSTSEWLAADNDVKVTKKFESGKAVKVSLTVKKGKKDVKGANVFVVDTKGILKKFKKVKYSGISVKCDGKAVKGIKYKQGYFEKKQGTNSWRLSFFNKWGDQGDNTGKNGTSKKYVFKKNLTVSFTVTAK